MWHWCAGIFALYQLINLGLYRVLLKGQSRNREHVMPNRSPAASLAWIVIIWAKRRANLLNRYSALCWMPVTHAQTWASYNALYRFRRLSKGKKKVHGQVQKQCGRICNTAHFKRNAWSSDFRVLTIFAPTSLWILALCHWLSNSLLE